MQQINVAIAMVIQNEAVLVAKRHAHQHLGGLWEFPGGKVEADESIEDTLKRELKEEVGLEIGPVHLLEPVSHDYEDRSVTLWPFVVREFSEQPVALEGNELQWWPLAKLSELAMPAANQPLLAQLQKLQLDTLA